MVAYLKASLHKKAYSDYLWAVREAEKVESMKLSQNPWSQVIDNATKPKLLVFPFVEAQGESASI